MPRSSGVVAWRAGPAVGDVAQILQALAEALGQGEETAVAQRQEAAAAAGIEQGQQALEVEHEVFVDLQLAAGIEPVAAAVQAKLDLGLAESIPLPSPQRALGRHRPGDPSSAARKSRAWRGVPLPRGRIALPGLVGNGLEGAPAQVPPGGRQHLALGGVLMQPGLGDEMCGDRSGDKQK